MNVPASVFVLSASPPPSLLGKFDEVYEALAHAHPNLTVYKKEEIPERWHYRYNSRIQPIIAVADNGWYVLRNKSDDFLCEYVIVFLPILHPCWLQWRPGGSRFFAVLSSFFTDEITSLYHALIAKEEFPSWCSGNESNWEP